VLIISCFAFSSFDKPTGFLIFRPLFNLVFDTNIQYYFLNDIIELEPTMKDITKRVMTPMYIIGRGY
ncbi:MAG: hypothetical protein PVH88_08475, partial [Ignavibacteria bacterium]